MSQTSTHALEHGEELREYSIPRRPVSNGRAGDTQETRPLVETERSREPSLASTLNAICEGPHSHYYDGQDSSYSTRNHKWSIRSMLQRWTPGQYDHPSDQNSYTEPHKNYMRRYSYRKARSQIIVPGLSQLLVTCILVAGLAAIFDGYSKEETLDTNQRHIFNFLMTGLIIALTISLTSSMRSCVQVLRWRLLAATSLTIEQLDLALDCASQTMTLKLFYLYTFKDKQRRWWQWTRVQLLCIGWILLNLASAIVTGLLGLTQETAPVTALIRQTGSVQVLDLSSISSIASGSQYDAQQFAVNAYGVQGAQDYLIQLANDALTEHYPGAGGDLVCPLYSTSGSNCIYVNEPDDFAAYRLNIINPQEYQNGRAYLSSKSDFSVHSNAVCVAYNVLHEPDHQAQDLYFDYTDNQGQTNKLYVKDWAPGSVTYISDPSDPSLLCGSRCARILAVQAKQSPDNSGYNPVLNITQSTVFDCENTVSYIHNLTSNEIADIPFNEAQAQLVAGAVAWTGFFSPLPGTETLDTREYHLYPPDSYWSPSYQLRTKDVVDDEFLNNPNDY